MTSMRNYIQGWKFTRNQNLVPDAKVSVRSVGLQSNNFRVLKDSKVSTIYRIKSGSGPGYGIMTPCTSILNHNQRQTLRTLIINPPNHHFREWDLICNENWHIPWSVLRMVTSFPSCDATQHLNSLFEYPLHEAADDNWQWIPDG